MFSLRLKAQPDRYKGDWYDKGFITAHWFTTKANARIWTKEPVLKRALTASGPGKWEEHSWSVYEVEHADGTIEPLDALLQRWRENA